MKKFSLLLIGAFLLGTITFVLADESQDVESTTGTTSEVTMTDTAEATTIDTAETTSTEIEVDTTESEATDVTETTTLAENADIATPTISDSVKEKYGEEQIAAYEWALENGITTINDVDKARLADGLTRAELAKMMSQYLTKVLGKTPATTEEKANYADVDASLGDLADFIQTACAYKIMGINTDGTALKEFNPYGLVTRAEYATVFSRVLYGDKYNKSEGNYYDAHIEALKEAGILTNTTPSIQEVRGWVMLMMYRSVNVKSEANEESNEQVVGMPNPASVYCEEQGGTLNIVKDEEGNEAGMCKLVDGTEVDEWEYYRVNHPETADHLYSEEELNAAKSVIMETVNGWDVTVESFNVDYAGDDIANNNLEYCQSLNSEVTECAVFTSSFHIPEQDVQMAGAFEPNADINGYSWYLGRSNGGNWTVLTNGLG